MGPALVLGLMLGLASQAEAEDRKWKLELEPMYMQTSGHDPHVLTIHEIDLDSTPRVENKAAVNLETEDGLAYRLGLERTMERWGLGVSFFWFTASQVAADRIATGAGPENQAVFEIADRRFTSADPNDVLFYGVLEDTDLAVWTVDLYGRRTLADKPNSGVHLLFGLKLGDFDNDYRAVAGVRGVGGTRVDASSNYGRMTGPMVGLAADFQSGKSSVEGYIGQSVLLGSVELTNMSRDFTGPFSEMPAFSSQEVFTKEQDVAIPITEFRVKWTYRISNRIALGAGANAATWWDVPVPPGVLPIENGDQVLHENTIVFLGLLGSLEVTF